MKNQRLLAAAWFLNPSPTFPSRADFARREARDTIEKAQFRPNWGSIRRVLVGNKATSNP